MKRLAPVLTILLLAGCTKGMRHSRMVSHADQDFAAHQYDRAEGEYVAAIRLKPSDPEPFRQLGLLYADEGRPMTAVMYLKKSLTLEPDRADTQLMLGQLYMGGGAQAEAEKAAISVLEKHPENADALILLTSAAQSPAEIDAAWKRVQALRAADSDRASYHLAFGILLLRRRDLAGGDKEISRALELDPKSAVAHLEEANLDLTLRHDVKGAGQQLKLASDLSPVRSALRIRYIDFLFRTGSVADGKARLEELAKAAPDYVPATEYRMRLAYAEHRYDDCAALVRQVLDHDPYNYGALSQRGALSLVKGDFDGAINDFKRAETAFSHSPELKVELAQAYLRKSDVRDATDSLNQALRLQPAYIPALLLLAQVELRGGQYADAARLMGKLLTHRPAPTQAYLLLADAYRRQTDFAKASSIYVEMAHDYPKDPQPEYLQGLMLVQQKQYVIARPYFEAALRKMPSYGPAIEMMINLDLTDNRPDLAKARVDELLKKYPKSAGPWLLRAKIAAAGHDTGGEETDLLKALDLDPANQTACLQLAGIYLRSHRTDEAVQRLNALASKSKNRGALLLIAMIESGRKNYAAAERAYERLLAEFPDDPTALNNLAYLEAENLGHLDKALALAQRGNARSPDDPHLADTLGWVMYRRKDYRGALAPLQDAADKQPSDPSVYYHLGMAHYMLGDEAAAKAALQYAVASKADFAERADARHRLAILAIDPGAATPAQLAELKRESAADPEDPVVLTRLAGVDQRSGGAKQAAARLEEALKINPSDTKVMYQLAGLYAGPLDNLPRARELAKNAHDAAPNDLTASRELGLILYQTGEYSWSLDELTAAAGANAPDPDLGFAIARTQFALGRTADAHATLRGVLAAHAAFRERAAAERLAALIDGSASPAAAAAALARARSVLGADKNDLPAGLVVAETELNGGQAAAGASRLEAILARAPAFVPALRQLDLYYVEDADDEQKAFDFATKAKATLPDDPVVAKCFAIATYRHGDYDAALPLLSDLARRSAGDGELVCYLGLTHAQLKDTVSAKAELQRALSMNLSGSEADEAKRALEGLDDSLQATPGSAVPNPPIN